MHSVGGIDHFHRVDAERRLAGAQCVLTYSEGYAAALDATAGGLPIRATITELMRANLLEVFNERDAARRRATIKHVYADDIRWTDDDGVTTGRDALDKKAAELQAKLGDLQFIAAGPVYQTLGLGYLAFQLVNPEARRRRSRDSMLQSCETDSSSSCTQC